LVLVLTLAVSTAADLASGRIYNVITYPAMAAGLMLAAAGWGPALPSAIAGGLAAGVPFYALFALRWMGGGDVKLMTAVGTLTGMPLVLHAMFYAIFCGGVCAALILIWRGELAAVAGDAAGVARRAAFGRASARPLVPRGGAFPFGAAIAAGTLIALVLEWRA
jgi:prepilin peptidase CpaA